MREIEKINSNYNYSYNHIKKALNKLKELIDTKQAALTAGDNITIANGVISATDTDNYNDLSNKPIRNQDLDDAEFVPVANTYYRHTGASATMYTIGAIYYYDGTNFNIVGAAGGKMYRHNILLKSGDRYISCNIISNDNTPFTSTSLKTYMSNNYTTPYNATISNAKFLNASGGGVVHYTDYDMFIFIVGLTYYEYLSEICTVQYKYNQNVHTESFELIGNTTAFQTDVVTEL